MPLAPLLRQNISSNFWASRFAGRPYTQYQITNNLLLITLPFFTLDTRRKQYYTIGHYFAIFALYQIRQKCLDEGEHPILPHLGTLTNSAARHLQKGRFEIMAAVLYKPQTDIPDKHQHRTPKANPENCYRHYLVWGQRLIAPRVLPDILDAIDLYGDKPDHVEELIADLHEDARMRLVYQRAFVYRLAIFRLRMGEEEYQDLIRQILRIRAKQEGNAAAGYSLFIARSQRRHLSNYDLARCIQTEINMRLEELSAKCGEIAVLYAAAEILHISEMV